jgi:hypothetical protein
MVAATLCLLAFTLAFTFGLAAGRFDARQQFILDEANAIRASHLRSCLSARTSTLGDPRNSASVS